MLTFNSLFEIPYFLGQVLYAEAEGLFQFSFWDSGRFQKRIAINGLDDLSILFLRFHANNNPGEAGEWNTAFNSLFEIQDIAGSERGEEV